ncbi:hypothetical protein ACIBQ1_52195 [Nonomuraea sp. NPDC050153]|uniref:hypothetical protein n=1 Tax=Nonomuraea sp. NPDC050153 TaxID=3364359 RepID=UPI0037BDE2F6
MRRRVLIGAGAVVAVAATTVLGLYFVRVGLDEADKLASVIGAFVGLAGLGVAVYGLIADRRSGGGGQEPPPVAGGGSGEEGPAAVDAAVDVRQRAKASGSGRVYQAGRDQTINER